MKRTLPRRIPLARPLSLSLRVALTVILAAHPAVAQSDTSWATLQSAFQKYVVADSIVGASLLALRDGALLQRVNIGSGDRAREESVNDATIFHWGSITKTLTAVAIMQLRDRGKLSLDDKITRYIPELRQLHNPFGSMDDITLRMLMSHSSGFQSGTWPYTTNNAWEPFEPTRWEQLVSMMPYQQIHFAPGSRYGYSNPAFIYLARVIEQLTGDPWIHYIQKNIWTPLGLTHSYVNGTPYDLEKDRSNNYYVRRDSASGALRITANGRDFDPGITIPNGGWNAPLGDIAAWTAFLTNATSGDAGRQRTYDTILSRKSLEEMWTSVVPLSSANPANGTMGMSFFIYPHGAARIIGHTGSQAAFRAFFYFNPRTRRGVIAAYNTTNLTELPGARNAQRDLNDVVMRYLERAP